MHLLIRTLRLLLHQTTLIFTLPPLVPILLVLTA
ncbi:unnamed protein product [Schistosoma margrebowiei]|uniref:Uncharacterized protein n=1 Tax=Schistosoma margrebowiei TaxID=48269 RepID=A0A183N4R2_9TREM|nr:unnamed protein product [Schistosoma margrebowiei]